MKMLNKKEIRILYLGTPEISAVVLEKMINSGYNIVGLIAQEDRERNRKKQLLPVPTKVVAEKYGVPCFQPERLNKNIEIVESLKPDLILTLAYGQLVSTTILGIPPLGCLNLHGSLLPKYRGAAPIQYALLNGDKVSGITLMEMVKEMDAGKMFYKVEVPVEEKDNYTTLTAKLADAAFRCFDEGIEDVINKVNLGEEQDPSLVTFTSKITHEDEKMNFSMKSVDIINKMRALSMAPGVYFVFNDVKYKVFDLEVGKTEITAKPGEVVSYNKNAFEIATGDGTILVKSIQKPGKKVIPFKDFFNGERETFHVGDLII